jgi:hypothetical protein
MTRHCGLRFVNAHPRASYSQSHHHIVHETGILVGIMALRSMPMVNKGTFHKDALIP